MILKDASFLLLEDDKELASTLVETLELYCKKVFYAQTSDKARDFLDTESISLIICDIYLKNENGLDFLEELKNNDCSIPMLIISSFEDKEFLYKAIKLRVIDYLVKPIDIDTIESTLNECEKYLSFENDSLWNIDNTLVFNPNKKVITKDGEEINLTPREYNFLKLAKKYENQLITQEMIEHHIFYDDELTVAKLKNLIFRLRKKLGQETIQTLPNIGYRIKSK